MNVRAVLLPLLTLAVAGWSDTRATGEDGRIVLLHPDGTWVYEGDEQAEPFQILSTGFHRGDAALGKSIDLFGTVRNNTGARYSEVVLSVQMLDDKGDIVGVECISVYDFRPGTTRAFRNSLTIAPDPFPSSIVVTFDRARG